VSKTITVATTQDATVEDNETYTINLSGATSGTVVDNIGVGTIVNEDTSAFVWTGAGGDSNWNTAANWSGGVAPNNTQTAIFNNMCTQCNATINANIDVGGIRMDSNYSGTVTQNSTRTIIIGTA
jgi:hypothetical protein